MSATLTAEAYRSAGLTELGGWLRTGRCTPTELAEVALAELRARAMPLNAVVTLAPARARTEAALATTAFAAGFDHGPLQGIPYGAKDLLATTGLPTTWGAVPLRDQTFAEEATVIRLLRQAGAVLTAKLAMVELAGGAGYRQPDASLTGPGRNPWQPEHWAGGSSNGSAAAVACGALPYALGSETWGSILGPAGFCGIVGARPTYGLVSRRGAMALSWTMDKLGPLARSVADCAAVLAVIGVPDPDDPTSSGQTFRYRPARFADWRPRFGLLRDEVASADPDVARAVEATLPHLERLGSLIDVALPDLPYAEVGRLTISAEMAAAFDDLIASGAVTRLTAPEDRVTPYVFETISAADYLRTQRVRGRIAGALAHLLTQVDCLVAPTSPVTAPRLDASAGWAGTRPRRSALGAASNLAGLPAVTLPIGLDSAGLPIGLQLVADAFADEALLVAAAGLERHIAWAGQPPSLAPASPIGSDGGSTDTPTGSARS